MLARSARFTRTATEYHPPVRTGMCGRLLISMRAYVDHDGPPFPLPPRACPVQMSYLQSYRDMGAAKLSCESGCKCTPQVIDGWSDRPVSVSVMADIQVGATEGARAPLLQFGFVEVDRDGRRKGRAWKDCAPCTGHIVQQSFTSAGEEPPRRRVVVCAPGRTPWGPPKSWALHTRLCAQAVHIPTDPRLSHAVS